MCCCSFTHNFFFYFTLFHSAIPVSLYFSLCVNWNQFSVSCTGAKNRLQSIWHSNDMFTSNTSSVSFIYSFLYLFVRFGVFVWNSTRIKLGNVLVFLLLLWFVRENANDSRQVVELLNEKGVFFTSGICCKNVQRSATMTSTEVISLLKRKCKTQNTERKSTYCYCMSAWDILRAISHERREENLKK